MISQAEYKQRNRRTNDVLQNKLRKLKVSVKQNLFINTEKTRTVYGEQFYQYHSDFNGVTRLLRSVVKSETTRLSLFEKRTHTVRWLAGERQKFSALSVLY